MEQASQMLSSMPYSTIFIVFVSIMISLLSAWSTRRFTDIQQMKSDMAEWKAWQEKLKLARKTMDPILLQEVLDEQSRIMAIQGRLTSARMKPMCIFYVPLILIFGALNAFYGQNPVAVLPFNVLRVLPFMESWIGTSVGISGGFGLYFWSWYMLAVLAVSGLIRRLSGIEIM